MLNVISKLLGIPDVLGSQRTDTFCICLVEGQGHTKGNRRHYCQLVCSINSLNVERRVSLCIAEGLCFPQHVGKLSLLLHHLGEYEIASAVNDARQPIDSVSGKTLAKRFHNR